MEMKFCQSCGMPLTSNEVCGTNADGSLSADYCTYCYQNGKFTQDCTMDEMIEHCAQFVEEFNKDSEQKVTKEEAIAMKTEYEQNMQQAKAKASDIVTEAQRTASLQSEEILKSAAQEARAMKEKAESDIAQEKRKAVNEVKNEIGGMAMEIAGKVIEREINEEDHAKLIDEFISNVGEAS